jgi:hypothetical protein
MCHGFLVLQLNAPQRRRSTSVDVAALASLDPRTMTQGAYPNDHQDRQPLPTMPTSAAAGNVGPVWLK